MAKKKSKKSTAEHENAIDAISFEEAMEKLQQIVGQLEQGKLTLADSLQAYESGVSMLKACYRGLEDAETRIQVLTGVDSEGRVSLVDFDASATAEQLQAGAGSRRSTLQDPNQIGDGHSGDSDMGDSDIGDNVSGNSNVEIDNEDFWDADEEDSSDDDGDAWDDDRRLF